MVATICTTRFWIFSWYISLLEVCPKLHNSVLNTRYFESVLSENKNGHGPKIECETNVTNEERNGVSVLATVSMC